MFFVIKEPHPAKNISGVIYMKKENNKNNQKNAAQIKNSRKVIDLTSYISADMAKSDTQGSYTGTTKSTYDTGEYEEPVQDADDL